MLALRIAQTTAAAALMAGLPADLVRVTWALPATAVLLPSGLWLAENRPPLRLGLAAAAISALPVVMIMVGAALTPGTGLSGAAYAGAYAAALVSLAVAAALPWWGATSAWADRMLGDPGARSVAAAIAVFGLLTLIGRSLGGHPFVFSIDETLYHFQAGHLLHSPRGMPLDATLEPFFRIRQSYVHDGFLNGQYTPGWPALLAVLGAVGLTGLAPTLVYTGTLFGIALLARALKIDWETTLVGVILTGTTFLYFDSASSYFAHGATTLFALGAAISAVLATRNEDSFRLLPWCAAGLFVGLACIARPLTGAVCALLLAWWCVRHGRFRIRALGAAAVGGIGTGLALLAYNQTTSGSPGTFGYRLSHGGLQSLGFGARGEVWFDSSGVPRQRVIDFQPLDGLAKFLLDTGQGVLEFWPGALILLVGAAAITARERVPWSLVLAFLLLPVVHGAYYFSDTRLFVESLPFAMLATAVAANRVRSLKIGLGRPVILAAIFTGTAATAGEVGAWAQMESSRHAYFEVIEAAREEHGPLLVFVAQEREDGVGATEHALEALFWYNTGRDDVVVGRDVEALRPAMLAAYPDHVPIRLIAGQENAAGHWAPPIVEVIPGL